MPFESHAPLFTTEQVILLRDDRARVAKEIEKLREDLDLLDRKLEAVRLLAPDFSAAFFDDRTDEKDERPFHEQPWTAVVIAMLDGEMGGRSARWFREKMEAMPAVAERLEASPTGLHNALSRLAMRGGLEKRGNLYYLPDVFEKIKAGDLEEVEGDVESHSISATIHEILASHPNGLKPKELVEEVRRHPELADKAGRGSEFVYRFLSREKSRHRLVKEGDRYRTRFKRDGASPADTGDAPTAGEGNASPLFDRVHRLNNALG